MTANTRRRHPRGQALVEFAFVIPIFLLLLFGIFDVGRVVWATNTDEQAAREASRFAIVNGANKKPPADKPTIAAVATNSAVAAGASVTVTICYGAGCSGNTDVAGAGNTRGTPVTVVVRSQVPLVAGAFLGLGTFQVSGSSTMLVNY